MTFDPKVVPRQLIEAARRRTLVPFVGAGISRQAGEAFPGWCELLKYMKEHALIKKFLKEEDGKEIEQFISKNEFPTAAQVLRNCFPPDEFESILEEKFDPPWGKPVEIHKALFRLHPPLVLTTNYDRLMEDAYAAEYGRTLMVLTYNETPKAQRYLKSGRLLERPLILKIHGTIDDPEHIILSKNDYQELINQQPGYQIFLSAIFLTQTVLMLGFSFTDPEIKGLLESLRNFLRYRSCPDYIFLPDNEIGPVEMRRWWEDFGVQVIPYELSSSNHSEVLEFVNFLVSQVRLSP